MDQSTIDNLSAQRIVHYLVTPFDQWEAGKLGIIDRNGKVLRNPTPIETKYFNFFHVLVVRLRELLKTSGKGTAWVLAGNAGKFYLGQSMPPTNFTNWTVSNRSQIPIHNASMTTFKECIEMYDDSLLESFVGRLCEDGEGVAPSNVAGQVADAGGINMKDRLGMAKNIAKSCKKCKCKGKCSCSSSLP